MSVKFNKQYFTFNKILETNINEVNPNKSYAKASMSTSWKKQDGTRKFSDWIVRFSGKCVVEAGKLVKGDFIMCNGSFTREPYEKEGKRTWADAQVTIFEFEKWQKKEEEHIVEEEYIPF
jgi:hypothetical protein